MSLCEKYKKIDKNIINYFKVGHLCRIYLQRVYNLFL